MLRHAAAGPVLAGLRIWRAVAGRDAASFRILVLHDIADEHLPVLDALVSSLKVGGMLLSPAEAEARLLDPAPAERRRSSPPPCLLSFDDGFVSNLTAAETVLNKHQAQVLFFVCPGLIDLTPAAQRDAIAKNIFDGRTSADALPADLRLMNWDEVRRLEGLGHTVGAHGMSHRRLSLLEGAELRREIAESGARLHDELGHDVPWYAYAFGDIGSITWDALAVIREHFQFCRSGIRGLNVPATKRHGLRADQIDLGWPATYRRLVLEGGLTPRYRAARRRLDFQLLQ